MSPATTRHNPFPIILAIFACATFIAAIAQPAVAADQQPVTATNVEAIDKSLQAASRYFAHEQSADGAWRSRQYPALADGLSLTPLVLRSLYSLREPEPAHEVWQRGADYLVIAIGSNQPLPEAPAGSLNYGLYTAAGALVALPDTARFAAARKQCRGYLLSHQLREPLGWRPDDPEYGGWGYAPQLSNRPLAGQPLAPLDAPNLSATAFALEALRRSDLTTDRDVTETALRFVMRCQNYDAGADAAFDDGGFYFVLDDATRNKAGVAGTDRLGRTRYRSYVTATADGLRALRLCGVATDHPRIVAARAWLNHRLARLSPTRDSLAEPDGWRPASHFYGCWSVSLGLEEFSVDDAKRLAQMLLARQQSDGSWTNGAVDLREDDKLVATAFAVEALARCRLRIHAP